MMKYTRSDNARLNNSRQIAEVGIAGLGTDRWRFAWLDILELDTRMTAEV